MPTNEKEYNGYLLDQLSAVERIERQVKKGDLKAVEEEIEILAFITHPFYIKFLYSRLPSTIAYIMTILLFSSTL